MTASAPPHQAWHVPVGFSADAVAATAAPATERATEVDIAVPRRAPCGVLMLDLVAVPTFLVRVAGFRVADELPVMPPSSAAPLGHPDAPRCR